MRTLSILSSQAITFLLSTDIEPGLQGLVGPGSGVLKNVRAILLIIQDAGIICSAPKLHIIYLEPVLR